VPKSQPGWFNLLHLDHVTTDKDFKTPEISDELACTLSTLLESLKIFSLRFFFWLWLMQEFFQRQRNAVERNGAVARRHQTQQKSTRVSQDLITPSAAKRSVQTHQGM